MLSLYEINVLQFTRCHAHLGHRVVQRNPMMQHYLFGVRSGYHLFEFDQIFKHLRFVLSTLESVMDIRGAMIYVTENVAVDRTIKNLAETMGALYSSRRWIGGVLSNYHRLRKHMLYKLKKRGIKRSEVRVNAAIYGIIDMRIYPQLALIFDVNKSKWATNELRRMCVGTIAIVDSNSFPDSALYILPGNTQGLPPILLYANFVNAAHRRYHIKNAIGFSAHVLTEIKNNFYHWLRPLFRYTKKNLRRLKFKKQFLKKFRQYTSGFFKFNKDFTVLNRTKKSGFTPLQRSDYFTNEVTSAVNFNFIDRLFTTTQDTPYAVFNDTVERIALSINRLVSSLKKRQAGSRVIIERLPKDFDSLLQTNAALFTEIFPSLDFYKELPEATFQKFLAEVQQGFWVNKTLLEAFNYQLYFDYQKFQSEYVVNRLYYGFSTAQKLTRYTKAKRESLFLDHPHFYNHVFDQVNLPSKLEFLTFLPIGTNLEGVEFHDQLTEETNELKSHRVFSNRVGPIFPLIGRQIKRVMDTVSEEAERAAREDLSEALCVAYSMTTEVRRFTFRSFEERGNEERGSMHEHAVDYYQHALMGVVDARYFRARLVSLLLLRCRTLKFRGIRFFSRFYAPTLTMKRTLNKLAYNKNTISRSKTRLNTFLANLLSQFKQTPPLKKKKKTKLKTLFKSRKPWFRRRRWIWRPRKYRRFWWLTEPKPYKKKKRRSPAEWRAYNKRKRLLARRRFKFKKKLINRLSMKIERKIMRREKRIPIMLTKTSKLTGKRLEGKKAKFNILKRLVRRINSRTKKDQRKRIKQLRLTRRVVRARKRRIRRRRTRIRKTIFRLFNKDLKRYKKSVLLFVANNKDRKKRKRNIELVRNHARILQPRLIRNCKILYGRRRNKLKRKKVKVSKSILKKRKTIFRRRKLLKLKLKIIPKLSIIARDKRLKNKEYRAGYTRMGRLNFNIKARNLIPKANIRMHLQNKQMKLYKLLIKRKRVIKPEAKKERKRRTNHYMGWKDWPKRARKRFRIFLQCLDIRKKEFGTIDAIYRKKA